VQEKYKELVECEAEVLQESDANALSARYQRHGVVPDSFSAEAMHRDLFPT
jgi:hypothetical protein